MLLYLDKADPSGQSRDHHFTCMMGWACAAPFSHNYNTVSCAKAFVRTCVQKNKWRVTIFSQWNALGVYFKLTPVNLAFSWLLHFTWAVFTEQGFLIITFTAMYLAIIPEAYYTSCFGVLLKTAPWIPSV